MAGDSRCDGAQGTGKSASYQALHDPLTKLRTAFLFRDRLEHALEKIVA